MAARTRATVLALLLMALLAGGAHAAGIAAPKPDQVPHVPGDGVLFAYSGLDGETKGPTPATATIEDKGLTLRFHLPGNPVVRILLAENQRLTWRAFTNDLLVADVAGDEMPMVVAWVSRNVVAGRLPAGARAAFTGGDANSVVLRKEIGDWSRFAFAYHTDGTHEAARLANEGLRVSLDSLVENRLDFYAKVFREVGDFPRPRIETLAKAFSVMKVNVWAPEPPFTQHWTTPSRWPDRHQNTWAAGFNAIGLMHVDRDLAKEAMTAVYRRQGKDGMVPAWAGPGKTVDYAQPPMLAWFAWQIYLGDKHRDPHFLQTSYDVASKQVLWFLKHRRLGGPPPENKPITYREPLYFWASAEEAGTPGSPRWSLGQEFAAIDLSCYLAAECRTLYHMAQRLGYRVLAMTWRDRADDIAAAARTHLWNAEAGFFFDRQGRNGPFSNIWSYAGLLPLATGVADEAQAARLRAYVTSGPFCTPAGIPTLGKSKSGYDGRGWTGGVWTPMNYFFVRGLQQQRRDDLADDLAKRTLAVTATLYHQTGTLPQFILTQNDPTAAGTRDYFPTAAVYADLLLRPKP